MNAKLSCHIFYILCLRGNTMPVYHTFRVDVDLVGNRCQVIASLGILVTVCDDPLAALLEVSQCITNFLKCRIVRSQDTGFQIDSLHLVFILGLLDGRENVVHTKVVELVSCQFTQPVVLNSVADLPLQLEHHHRIVFQRRFAAACCYHTNEADESEYRHDDTESEDTNDGGCYILEKLFHNNANI